MRAVSEQYLINPSRLLQSLVIVVHLAALLALPIVGLNVLSLCVIAVLILQSGCQCITAKNAQIQLTLSENECLLDGEVIQLAREYFDTPWLLVLRSRRRSPSDEPKFWTRLSGYYSTTLVLVDSMNPERRRALSRQLRWQSFS